MLRQSRPGARRPRARRRRARRSASRSRSCPRRSRAGTTRSSAAGIDPKETGMVQTAGVGGGGGGVNGTSIAYALASKGARCVLVEKGAVASGASGRSSALVRMHYTNEWDARLAWASFPVFRHWSELIGGPPVFTHTGFVNAVAPAYAEHLRKNVEMLRGIGINTQAITAAELKDLQPFANVDDVGAAAYEPDSSYANPAETVEGFRRRTEELAEKSC